MQETFNKWLTNAQKTMAFIRQPLMHCPRRKGTDIWKLLTTTVSSSGVFELKERGCLRAEAGVVRLD